jgi:hypothetical protein
VFEVSRGNIFFALKIKNERLSYEPDKFEINDAYGKEIKDTGIRITLIIAIYILFIAGLICCDLMLGFFLDR